MKTFAISAMILVIFLLAGCDGEQDNPFNEQGDTIKDTVKIIPVKYSDSTEGCIGEGYHLIIPGIQEEWEARKDLQCCEGLTAISEAEYPRLFDNHCNAVEGSGELCSNCGNGICEDWESKCSCKEDCTTRVCELNNIGGCDRSCNSDIDCQEVCGAGCININENFDDKGVEASCPPMLCHCVDNICTEV